MIILVQVISNNYPIRVQNCRKVWHYAGPHMKSRTTHDTPNGKPVDFAYMITKLQNS